MLKIWCGAAASYVYNGGAATGICGYPALVFAIRMIGRRKMLLANFADGWNAGELVQHCRTIR